MDLKKYDLGYEDSFGHWGLRKAIAGYLRMARGVSCEPEHVIVVTGSQQGVNVIVRAMLKAGDKVWMEDPGYQGALMVFRNAGIEVCPVPIACDGLDINYGKEHYKDAGMAYVTPSHQFPMGNTLSYEKREALLAWAQENNSWILEDDYDSEFRYDGRPLTSLQGMDRAGRVLYMGTFSKVLFPGLRLAYVVLPSADLIPAFKQAKIHVDRQCPIMDQLMLCSFIEEGYFLRHIRKMRLLYAERQRILISLIDAHLKDYLSVSVSHSGMHLVCSLKVSLNIDHFKRLLKEKKLKASLTSSFSIVHPATPSLLLGFTAFSAYKLKVAVEKLKVCFEASII
jgi:GntR family transcriptional regulator/MocR family aminotransferase